MQYDHTAQALAPVRRLLVVTAALCAVTLVVAGVLLVSELFDDDDAAHMSAAWSAEHQRALAGKLRADGLRGPAISAFEGYFWHPGLTASERASAAYNAGVLCFEAARYEDALGWFYRVELADPESDVRAKASEYIVACLERLGRTIDARYALDRSTALDRDAYTNDVREAVVATYADERITLAELNTVIQELPPSQQQQLTSPQAQRALLEQMILQRLLVERARMRGLHTSPEITRAVRNFEENRLAAAVLESEMNDAVQVDDSDVELYYTAHVERFSRPARVQITCLLYDSHDLARAALEALLANSTNDAGFADATAEAREREALFKSDVNAEGYVTGLGQQPALARTVMDAQPGLVTNLVDTSRGPAIVRVDNRIPAEPIPFAHVKDEVTRQYRAEKQAGAAQAFQQQLLDSARVRVFADRLGARPDAQPGKK